MPSNGCSAARPRVKLPYWAIAASVVLGTVTALGVPPAPAVTAAAPAPVTVTVTTANVKVTLGPAQARADVARATGSSSVVLLQEFWKRRAASYVPAGWNVFHPSTPTAGCRDNAIAWRRDTWRLVRGYGFRVHYVAGLVGNCVAVAILEHRTTGQLLPVIGVHMLPHVEVAGHPRDLPRVFTYHAAIDRLYTRANLVWEKRGRVLLGGDWNVDGPADGRVRSGLFPWRHFHSLFDSAWGTLPATAPTLGRRRIDGFWWSDNADVPGAAHVRPVAARTVRGTYSDHNFERVTFRLG